MTTTIDGMPVRPWRMPTRDGRNHGVVWMTDEQALDRLERGYAWVPVESAESLAATIAAELAADVAAA